MWFAILFAFMALFPLANEKLGISETVANRLAMGAGGLIIISTIGFILIPKNKISLINKHEEKSFWQIKKYDLIMDGIKVVIGFAVGIATAYVYYYFNLK